MKNLKEWIREAFDTAILNRKRHIWVDYLRGIVILLVVYHHTYLGIERSGFSVPKAIGEANMVFYSFRMPLFFIVSGIFTSVILLHKPVKHLIWSKFDKILYPYLIWAFLQITLQIVLSNFTNSDRSIKDYLYIFYQPKQIDQFWYLPALFNATLVFILVKTKLNPKAGMHILIGAILYMTAPLLNEVSMMSNWMRFYLFFVFGDIIAHFIFKKQVQTELKRPLYFLLMIPVFVVVQVLYLHNNVGAKAMETTIYTFDGNYKLYLLNEVNFLFTSMVGCITIAMFAFILERWGKLSFLRILGYHSIYIYITHVIIVGFVRLILTRVFHLEDPFLILFIGMFFGVVLPMLFYNLIGKKYLWFLFTTKKPKARTAPKPVIHTIETALRNRAL